MKDGSVFCPEPKTHFRLFINDDTTCRRAAAPTTRHILFKHWSDPSSSSGAAPVNSLPDTLAVEPFGATRTALTSCLRVKTCEIIIERRRRSVTGRPGRFILKGSSRSQRRIWFPLKISWRFPTIAPWWTGSRRTEKSVKIPPLHSRRITSFRVSP